MKGSLYRLDHYSEQPAVGVVPGSELSMNAEITAHKEVLPGEALLLKRVRPH